MTTFCRKVKYGPRRILVTGHFGSGKTEFSVSLAFMLAGFLNSDCPENALRESKLALADIDVENPYFRSREYRGKLEEAGVSVYSDPFGGRNSSELQTISASILAPIEDPDCRVIIDTGGNETGAMVLNQFSRHFGNEYQMLQIVNCNRPGTDTVEKAIDQIVETEKATGLTVAGLIANAHMIRSTTAEDVLHGYRFAKRVAALTEIPVLCVCAAGHVADELNGLTVEEKVNMGAADMEVFPVGMYMRKTYMDR